MPRRAIDGYLYTWGALVALTTLSFATSLVHFGGGLFVALAIAVAKAALIAAVFMHLVRGRLVESAIVT